MYGVDKLDIHGFFLVRTLIYDYIYFFIHTYKKELIHFVCCVFLPSKEGDKIIEDC